MSVVSHSTSHICALFLA